MVNIVADALSAVADEPGAPAAAQKPLVVVPPSQPGQPADAPRRMRINDTLPMIAVMLAVFGTTLSAVGLAVTSRTVAEAQVAIDTLNAHRPAAAQVALAAPAPAPMTTPAGPPPATVDDVARAVGALRDDLVRAQTRADSGGAGSTASTLRDGQTEIADRLGAILAKIDRIDRALNSSRAAKP